MWSEVDDIINSAISGIFSILMSFSLSEFKTGRCLNMVSREITKKKKKIGAKYFKIVLLIVCN